MTTNLCNTKVDITSLLRIHRFYIGTMYQI